MSQFPRLFSPLDLRGITVRNRILSTGHQTFLARNGVPADDLVAYHEARARGGAGLIIIEAARYHPSSLGDLPEINATNDDCIPGYRALADAVHRHGARLFGQLSHSGRCSMRKHDAMRNVVYAPSSVPDNRFLTMPRQMPTAMVEEIIQSCGSAAGRMAEAGLDGIEVSVNHGLLFSQFLNPSTNRRDDRFGGTFDNRLRPLAEALTAVRANVGSDLVVGIRISADEVESDGLGPDMVVAVCKALAGRGLIDYVNTTYGSMAGLGGSIHVVPPMEFEPGYVAPKAARLRGELGLPVFVAGRINQPHEAERILAEGQADMCGMTRAMIADADMARKAETGRLDDIRACIGCNQACIGHFHQGYSISCIQNPVSGRERRFGELARAARPRKVIVAGGGPGGMKAAVTAAARGHDVTLIERDRRLGGQALIAQLLPERAEFGGLITNLEGELARESVDVRLATLVDRTLLESERPDVVIIATGARAWRPPVEGGAGAHIVDARDVLTGLARPGTRVLVADWRCDWVGMGVAEKLARDGHHVRLAVNGLHAGQNLQPYLRDHWAGKLHRLGVEIITYARLFGADGETAYLVHSVTAEAIMCESIDTVVLAAGGEPDIELEAGIDGLACEVLLAGDCLCPRSAEEAVYEGMLAGLAV